MEQEPSILTILLQDNCQYVCNKKLQQEIWEMIKKKLNTENDNHKAI